MKFLIFLTIVALANAAAPAKDAKKPEDGRGKRSHGLYGEYEPYFYSSPVVEEVAYNHAPVAYPAPAYGASYGASYAPVSYAVPSTYSSTVVKSSPVVYHAPAPVVKAAAPVYYAAHSTPVVKAEHAPVVYSAPSYSSYAAPSYASYAAPSYTSYSAPAASLIKTVSPHQYVYQHSAPVVKTVSAPSYVASSPAVSYSQPWAYSGLKYANTW